jgi:acetylornithine deacetylase/succinyl-diaminopimelate desuccinylase-like protein
MRREDGRITVDGFYDAVSPLSQAERHQIASVPYDEAKYKKELGLTELFGEPGYTNLERAWVRPTLELNGIWGGFQGEGLKTVLPSQAHAKLTCRLVPGQEPDKIIELIVDHIVKQTPPGVTVKTTPFDGSARPYLIPADHPGNKIALGALEDVYGQTPYNIKCGATIPILEIFLRFLKAYSVSLGFSLHDENFHAPDEFFRLKSFQRGQEVYGRMLHGLSQWPAD